MTSNRQVSRNLSTSSPQGTTEFSFKRSAPEKIGFTKFGTNEKRAVCGLLMHASVAITPDGLPLGLPAAKFWSRSKFKGTDALKRKINLTRVPIDRKESMHWLDNLRLSTELTGAPERCVYIGTGKAISMDSTAWQRSLGPASWSGTAWIALRRTAIRPSPK